MGRDPRAARVGDRWGPYALLRPLDGAAGAWWRVAREGPAGLVRAAIAQRVPAEAVGGPARQSAVRVAARRAAALEHPHVARLQAAFPTDDGWVFAWDLAPGASLARAVVAHGPLSGGALVALGVAVAGALAAAHGLVLDRCAAPLVHGALTPAALRLGPDGEIWVTGWGGPRAVDAASPRDDVRALGALLLALAPGDPADADRCDSRAPGLGAVVADCLGPSPPSAAEVRAALEAVRNAATGPPLTAWAPVAAPPEVPPARRPSPWVGRGEAVAVLASALLDGTAPVVCVQGPAGVGKTALAARVAAAVAELPGGAVWVSAAGCATEDALLQAVARALGIAWTQVDAAVRDRPPTVWVLDGVDAGLAACAAVVERWAVAAPAARLLVTARTALPSAVARVYPLAPLAPHEAMDLFIACAAPWRPDDAGDRAEVAEVCRAVDGLPLAIRVCAPAAARLGLRAVRSRLSLAVRAEGRGGAGRARDARGSVAWAVAQLDDEAQCALAALTVFVDAFGWAEAERVAGGLGEVGGPVDRLAAAGLLDADPAGDGLRLGPVVREAALARATPGALAVAVRRHAEGLARSSAPEAVAPSEVPVEVGVERPVSGSPGGVDEVG